MTKGRKVGVALALAAGSAVVARARWAARGIDFAGKSVIIIGGSRGLGLIIARELAAEGAQVALVARDAVELERARHDIGARGGEVITIAADVRDSSQVEGAVERTADRFGGIDVLVNDAGIIQVGPLAHMTTDDFEQAMATHFWGPYFAMMAVLPYMRRGGARRIVNISSIGGRVAVPHLAPYCASKFALTGLSEAFGAELSREGIRVTTVWPGLMRTGSTYNAIFKGRTPAEFAWFHTAGSLPGLSINAKRAARQIVEACRRGDRSLTITLPAKLAIIANAAMPETAARVAALAGQCLPATAREHGTAARTGWQSASRLAPSLVTKLGDRAAAENNERPVNTSGLAGESNQTTARP